MTIYVALLRAVNVGGTGKLPMTELKAICEQIGFSQIRTYIASGNVVFESTLSVAKTKAVLEAALHRYAGKPVGVAIRTHAEMVAVLQHNPFATASPNRCVAIFLDQPPAVDAVTSVKHQVAEQLALGKREIYVHYGNGMATSKLVIAAAKAGTARNMNTIAKLIKMSAPNDG